ARGGASTRGSTTVCPSTSRCGGCTWNSMTRPGPRSATRSGPVRGRSSTGRRRPTRPGRGWARSRGARARASGAAATRVRRARGGAMPEVGGGDREAFLWWAWTDVPRVLNYDPDAMRVPESGPAPPAVHAGVNGSPRPHPGRAPGLPPKHVRRYLQLRRKVRRAGGAGGAARAGAAVAVVSKGDDELLRLDGRTACHFPPAAGGYVGHNPADSDEAVAQLDAVRGRGARYLVVPAPALWWLDCYEGFRRHLEERCPAVPVRDGSCRIYELSGPR